MPPSRAPNVFTIAASADFASTFVEAFLKGEIIAGFSAQPDPLALSRTTLYVPTRRAAKVLAAEFLRASALPAQLLPRILPLGALDESETQLAFGAGEGDDPFSPGLPPAIDPVARRMILSRLVLQWGKALGHAIVRVGEDGTRETDSAEALHVADTPADAWHLAGDLGRLIDEMAIEDCSWDALPELVSGLAGTGFDDYWKITTDFLSIAMKLWPEILAERGVMDGVLRRRKLVEAQAAQIALAEGVSDGPIIALGSTGTNKATARLLGAIAHAPQGAIVLPGLDLELDEAAWAGIGGAQESDSLEAGHPQAALHRLLETLGITRRDVVPLGAAPHERRARDAFLSAALLPASATGQWPQWLEQGGRDQARLALHDVTLIEAPDVRQEALALAIAMREALEIPGQTAALVTPDRDLALRVRGELLRWNIEVDDSGGEPLGTTPAGTLARLVLKAASAPLSSPETLALTGHTLARFGQSRQALEQAAKALEAGVLRAVLPAGLAHEELLAEAQKNAQDRHAHRSQKGLDWPAIAELMASLAQTLEPLRAMQGECPLPDWLAAHLEALERVCAAPKGQSPGWGEDAMTLLGLFAQLQDAAGDAPPLDFGDYCALFDQIAAQTIVRGPNRAHPRLKILGLLEARLLRADVMLLGGLDETLWPPQPRTDAFLNRPMRAALGLTPPERRIGQTAHDFVAAMGAQKVVISRAVKRGGAPTVPARFLQRMAALAGPDIWGECVARGKTLLGLAHALDQPSPDARPVERPLPCPPLAIRPARLSVTQIETLRRDPYAIYARAILQLEAVEKIGKVLGSRETGTILHALIEQFTKDFPTGPLPADARNILMKRAREELKGQMQDVRFAAFLWPRLGAGLDYYLAFESGQRQIGARILPEQKGLLKITLADGSEFELTGIADRIEIGRDGQAAIFDYKTGTPPTVKQVLAGFSPQLTLEAAMLERGAFGEAGVVKATSATYLQLGGGGDGGKTLDVKPPKEMDFAQLVAGHYAELCSLLNSFRDLEATWPPRPFPQFIARYNDYDHLARVKEWSIGAEERGEA